MLLIAVLSLFYIASAYFLVKNKKVVFLASLIPALAGHFYLLFLVDEANIKTLSVMSVLSLVSFFMVLISSLFVAFKKDTISYVVFALLASITIWMPAVFNIEFEKSVNYSGHLKSHIAISICAYISLTFAALYAVVLIIKDNHLKNVSSIGEIKLPLDYNAPKVSALICQICQLQKQTKKQNKTTANKREKRWWGDIKICIWWEIMLNIFPFCDF